MQSAFTNAALHWGGTIAAVLTAIFLGRLGLYWVLLLLLMGLAGVFTIATTGFASAVLLTIAVCTAGFGIIGCQGALNASSGLIYPVSCRPTGVGAALGIGRVGSLSGPLVGSYFLASGLPTQQMFFVPMVPLASRRWPRSCWSCARSTSAMKAAPWFTDPRDEPPVRPAPLAAGDRRCVMREFRRLISAACRSLSRAD